MPGTPLPEGALILGGVYVWRVDSSGPYLEYYDRDPGLEALPPAGEGLRFENWPHAPGGEGFELDAEGLTVTLARDFVVHPSEEGFTGIAFRTDPVVSAMGGLPGLCFRPPSPRSRPVLFSEGPVRLDGAVRGIGGLVTSGSLTLQGPSILDSRPDSGVSLEARGDITLQPVPLEVAEPRQDFAHFVAARLCPPWRSTPRCARNIAWPGGGTRGRSLASHFVRSGNPIRAWLRPSPTSSEGFWPGSAA